MDSWRLRVPWAKSLWATAGHARFWGVTYRESTIDIWGMGSLWMIAVVILVNMHLAMDIKRWLLLTHSLVWGSIIITYACVVGIGFYTHLPQLRDNIPSGKVTCILISR
ncbi:unnamed protein product [Camellia sinensis]